MNRIGAGQATIVVVHAWHTELRGVGTEESEPVEPLVYHDRT